MSTKIKHTINFKNRAGEIIPYKTHYFLEVEKDRIIVKVPDLFMEDPEKEEITIKHRPVEIENGPKADFIWKFFTHNSETIVLSSIAYNLENALSDDFVIPEKPKFENKPRKKR